MSDRKLYTNRLIFSVMHLCERTRELAQTPSPDALALMPMRECLGIIERTLDELGGALTPPDESEEPGAAPIEHPGFGAQDQPSVDAPRAPFPSGPAGPVFSSWLVGAEDLD